jgi:hypothetical protein
VKDEKDNFKTKLKAKELKETVSMMIKKKTTMIIKQEYTNNADSNPLKNYFTAQYFSGYSQIFSKIVFLLLLRNFGMLNSVFQIPNWSNYIKGCPLFFYKCWSKF